MNSSSAIDFAAVGAELASLAAISEQAAPAVTRIVFSDHDMLARAFVQEHCVAAGLAVRHDAVGNMFARWRGTEPAVPAVATGSHIDAIPNAGAYDGTVGVVGGLEAIRVLQRAGFRPRRSIELLVFTAEEPTRFGLGCLGSRLLAGTLNPALADGLRDSAGRTLADWRATRGFDGALESTRLDVGHYHAFVELHIEQGGSLERDGVDLGVVEKIAAPSSFRLELTGEGGHAGAVLMPGRRDALLAGAEVALAVERAVRASGSDDTVGTTGVFRIEPGAVNSVPARAHLEIDLRDTDVATREKARREIEASMGEICMRRGVEARWQVINSDPPAVCSAAILAAIESAAADCGLSHRRMVSRAYHDTLFMSLFGPVAMIFIPCHNGWSHRPDEYASPMHIAGGIAALAGALRRLAA